VASARYSSRAGLTPLPPSPSAHSLPGDYGFDPLKLVRRLCERERSWCRSDAAPRSLLSQGADPAALKWHQQAELIHGRWAMVGVAGVLVPELLTKVR